AIAQVATARADSEENPADETPPLPRDSYVRLEPAYTAGDRGRQSTLHGRIVLVYRGLLVPELGAVHFATGLRADLTLRHENTTGMGTLELLQVSGALFDWGAIGSGLAAVVPTATIGADVTQLGPAVFGQVIAIPHFELSLLVRALFGIEMDRSNALTMRLRPVVALKLPERFALSSDGEMQIDLLADAYKVPVNLNIARRLGNVVLQVGPELVVAGSDRGDF